MHGGRLRVEVCATSPRCPLRAELLLPDRVTPHTLRRTFATFALAAGRIRAGVGQPGHSNARLIDNDLASLRVASRADGFPMGAGGFEPPISRV
jgi:integrase